MSHADRNERWATVLADELARSGVRAICLAPGSRSAPLILACAQDERFRIFTHLDERACAFFALGIGKATGRPAVVLTTSGTAAANVFPAVVEAAQSDTPLLVLTADRPPALRHTDANQTIDQVGLYGKFTRGSFDIGLPAAEPDGPRTARTLVARAFCACLGPPSGPVHINLPFADPLVPPRGTARSESWAVPHDGGRRTVVAAGALAVPDETIADLAHMIDDARRGIIVAGGFGMPDREGRAAASLADAAGMPLLADPLSGARYCAGTVRPIVHYDAFLEDRTLWDALAPDLVLRFGSGPVSQSLTSFLAQLTRVPHIVVDAGTRWPDHLGMATMYVRGDPATAAEALAGRIEHGTDSAWPDRWQHVDRCTHAVFAEEHARDPFEGSVIAAIVETLPRTAALFIGNSLPVRDLDRFGGAREEPLATYGNRGASGIDGLVSTALGVAVGLQRPTVAIVGDISFYHDASGLFGARDVDVPCVIVVVQNDGGGIFHLLPVREWEPAFTRHIAVPHGLDFRHLAELHRLPFTRLDLGAPVADAVLAALESDGVSLIEVRSDREHNARRREESLTAVRAAVGTMLRSGESV